MCKRCLPEHLQNGAEEEQEEEKESKEKSVITYRDHRKHKQLEWTMSAQCHHTGSSAPQRDLQRQQLLTTSVLLISTMYSYV